jgi:4-amino-4-deoxy-L-arabinose transferase-like glycosyltransferase
MNSELQQLDSSSKDDTTSLPLLGLLFIGLVVILHCFSLPHLELQGEEGRRVIAAREMMSSGDPIIPTVWGQPYLNKPPLYPWLTVLASNFTGGSVNAITVRIPALLATLLTGLLLFLSGSRIGRPRAGFIAALLFLLCPVVIRKSTLGETDLLLTAGVAIYALEMLVIGGSKRRKLFSMIWMSAGLSIAFLAKGPSALPFVIGIMMATARRDGISRHRELTWWGPPLLALGISSLWAIAVTLRLEQLGSGLSAMEVWFGEAARSGSQDGWWIHRWEFIAGVFFGYLPASLLMLLSGKMNSGAGWLGDHRYRPLAFSIVVPFIIFLLWPSVQPRYLLPVLPVIAWLAAMILDESFDDRYPSVSGERALSIVTDGIRAVVTVAGVVAVAVGVARWFDESVFTNIPAVAPGEFMLLGTFLLLSTGLPFKGVERRSVEQSALRWILMLLAWSGCQATILLPFRGSDRPGQEVARSIEAVVPLQQQVWHDVSGRWNSLAQVERTLKIVSKQVQPVPGDWFLTMETQQPHLQDGWRTIELRDGIQACIGIHQRRVSTKGKEK